MMSFLLRQACRHTRLMRGALALSLILMINGCSGDSDKVVVDFSKTVPVARPGESASERSPCGWLSRPMISPKETFEHYRQLLAYIALKME